MIRRDSFCLLASSVALSLSPSTPRPSWVVRVVTYAPARAGRAGDWVIPPRAMSCADVKRERAGSLPFPTPLVHGPCMRPSAPANEPWSTVATAAGPFS